MSSMSHISRTVTPDLQTRPFHHAKYQVFRRMHADQMAYRRVMEEQVRF